MITVDGKGIVMRPEALREATARAAAAATGKLTTRLSKGEKRNRKRMATVGAVYDLTPVPRSPCDILAGNAQQPRAPAPVASGKWLTASVREAAEAVVARVFDEAERRDPRHDRAWVVLVDGNNHQLDLVRAQARARGVVVTVVIDFIHVLEYLRGAAWSLHDQADPDAETWVQRHASSILRGHARRVAAAIRSQLTAQGIESARAANAQRCIDYLTSKSRYLGYRYALARGWPIATGVIEGACRHLVKDRMDITGARWGLDGAEAVLKLRALYANGDLDDYLRFHLTREQQRIHHTCYAEGLLSPRRVVPPEEPHPSRFTDFFERARMLDTSVGQGPKDDPAKVARIGYEAMVEGQGDVVSGWKNKLQAVASGVLPQGALAEMHRRMAEPGSG